MQTSDRDRVFHRAMRRADLLRAVFIGMLLGVCVILSAYVGLSVGLMAGIGAFVLTGYFWSYTHRTRQRPIAEQVTLPALTAAFGQSAALPAAGPESELAHVFPGDVRIRCRDVLNASWREIPFTFANAVVRPARMGKPLFLGQWLLIRTDWTLPGRVSVTPHDEGEAPSAQQSDTVLPAVDSAFLRAYCVDTDAPVKAACVLSCPLLQTMLMQNPGVRLLVEDSIIRIAIPSDAPFFELSGLEESIAQVDSTTQQQIAIIQSWLDGVLSVELPDA